MRRFASEPIMNGSDKVVSPANGELLDTPGRGRSLSPQPEGGEEKENFNDLPAMALKYDVPIEQIAGMRNVFTTFDVDGDGVVQAKEVGELLRSLNLVTSRKMIRCIVEVVDIDGDGSIDFGEFVALMARVKTEADRAVTPEAEDLGDEAEAEPSRPKLSMEEEAKHKLRQQALAAFQRAVQIMAFQQMTGDADAMREQVTKILRTPPDDRTEWELQRFLMWVEKFDFIQKLPPSSESDVRIEVCRCMTSVRAKADFELCNQGDKGDCMYILLAGQIDIFEDEVGQPKKLLVSQGEGTSFGELAIMGDESERFRTATVACKTDCTFGVLHRDDYRRFILKMRQVMRASKL